jgi:hypothetical protein
VQIIMMVAGGAGSLPATNAIARHGHSNAARFNVLPASWISFTTSRTFSGKLVSRAADQLTVDDQLHTAAATLPSVNRVRIHYAGVGYHMMFLFRDRLA